MVPEVTIEQRLVPVRMPALLVDGDVTLQADAHVSGSQGSVHANGDLTVATPTVRVDRRATASGFIVADDTWSADEMDAGQMPRMPIPQVQAADFQAEADYSLRADGHVRDRNGVFDCDSGADGTGCRDTIPPGGAAPLGWVFSPTAGWSLVLDHAVEATFYSDTSLTIAASPGAPGAPFRLSLIVEGDIDVVGTPTLRPASAIGIQFIADRDIRVGGTAGHSAFEGGVLVGEQLALLGDVLLAGQAVVRNASSVSTLVAATVMGDSAEISFNGTVETVAYIVTGWRENP
ncbi:MAG: hypothetical protein R2712_02810 [Vicinamibacterales bacterium]